MEQRPIVLRTIALEEKTPGLQVSQTLGTALDIAKKMNNEVTIRFSDGFEMIVTPTSIKLLESWNSLHRTWSEMQKGAKESVKMEMETDAHFTKSDSEIKSDILVPHRPSNFLSAKEAKEIATEQSERKLKKGIMKVIGNFCSEGNFEAEFNGPIRLSVQEFFLGLGYKVETTEQNGNHKVKISWKQ